MADFLNFLISREPDPAETQAEPEKAEFEPETAPTFLDFFRSEIIGEEVGSDEKEPGQPLSPEPATPTDRSFRRFVSEVMLEKRVLAALKQTLPQISESFPLSPDTSEADPAEVDSDDAAETKKPEIKDQPVPDEVAKKPTKKIETEQSEKNVKEARLPKLEMKSQKIRFPTASEILRNSRPEKFQVETRRQPLPPPLRTIASFRERTALQILQTLAENEVSERSEISSEEIPTRKVLLGTERFRAAEIFEFERPRTELPQIEQRPIESSEKGIRPEIILDVSKIGKLEILKHRQSKVIERRIGQFEVPIKVRPSLRREAFREVGIDVRRVSLALGKTEKTEMMTKGRALGLELVEHVRAPNNHSGPHTQCDCPIHRHKVRIV